MNGLIPTRKLKGDDIDYYDCMGCGKRWKQTAKKIGHTRKACDAYWKKLWK